MNINTLNNNHVIIYNEGTATLFSYDTEIAKVYNSGGIQRIGLTKSWKYSVTTLKWLKVFLGTDCSKSEIQRRLDDSEYLNY